jgi:hypothetical protein
MSPAKKIVRPGIAAERPKQHEFFDLAERLRTTTDPEEANRLGDKLGRLLFGK